MSLRNRFNRWSSEAHLRGLPEMQRFPDDESRQKAVQDIYRGMYTWQFAVVLILHAVALWTVFFGVEYVIRTQIAALSRWSAWVSMVLVLIGYAVFIVVCLRRDSIRDLRRKLIEAGVPVCVKCGYDLRGAPAEGDRRCPECGEAATDEPGQRE